MASKHYSYDRRTANGDLHQALAAADVHEYHPRRGTQNESYRVTAEDLCRALWGKGVEYLSLGTYPGTRVPLRKVPPNAPVTITDKGVVTVADEAGGWIADKFGPVLGRREWRRALTQLQNRGTVT